MANRFSINSLLQAKAQQSCYYRPDNSARKATKRVALVNFRCKAVQTLFLRPRTTRLFFSKRCKLQMTYNLITFKNNKGHRAKPDKVRTQRLMHWTQNHHQLLAACDSQLPGRYNRKIKTWRLLFAIGKLAGGQWLQRVKAVVTLIADNTDENASSRYALSSERVAGG
jgi:uncharacterized protein DUF3631